MNVVLVADRMREVLLGLAGRVPDEFLAAAPDGAAEDESHDRSRALVRLVAMFVRVSTCPGAPRTAPLKGNPAWLLGQNPA